MDGKIGPCVLNRIEVMKRKDWNESPLTDEQFIREALKTVNAYEGRHPGDRFNIAACVDEVEASLKAIWRKAKRIPAPCPLSKEDQGRLAVLKSRISAPLREKAREKATECLRRRKVQQISATTAEALIGDELSARGLHFFFEPKRRFIKVTVRLEHKRAATFSISYKQVREGRLPGILEDIFAMVEAINRLNTGVRVWPLTGKWTKWEGWKQ